MAGVSRSRGGASGGVRAPCLQFCGGGGCWLPPGLRAGGGSSAVGRKSSPVMVGMMAALSGCRSPCWGRHGEALSSRCGGLSG
jgi:hypothetical protein